MKLLLDTHTLLWVLRDPERLSIAARTALSDPSNQLGVSIATLWEITIKIGAGKLILPGSDVMLLAEQLDAFRIELLPILPAHLRTLQQLPLHHRDPFDRMLIAQAIAESMLLVSVDVQIRQYAVELLW